MKKESMSKIKRPARAVPVWGSWDVVVAGGGIAGVAAALAAKNGRNVDAVDIAAVQAELTRQGVRVQ